MVARLRAAVEEFERCEMKLHAAAARRSLGLILGGDAGKDLVGQSAEWMAQQSIRNAARMTRMLIPIVD